MNMAVAEIPDAEMDIFMCTTDDGVEYDIEWDDMYDFLNGYRVTVTMTPKIAIDGEQQYTIDHIVTLQTSTEASTAARAKYNVKLFASDQPKEMDILVLLGKWSNYDYRLSYDAAVEETFRMPNDPGYTTPFSGSVASLIHDFTYGKVVVSNNSRVVQVSCSLHS